RGLARADAGISATAARVSTTINLFIPLQRQAGPRVGNNVAMDQSPVRIDKWLWAARLVKTRALAVDAIRGGRVRVNGQPAKPSKDVRPGDRIDFSAGVIRFEATIR